MSLDKKVLLDFNCKGCGLCCREEGFVFFSLEDISRASRLLSLTAIAFIQKYLKYSEELLYYVEVTDRNPCIFLDKNNKCLIHQSKPKQCKTFPYWKEYTDKNGNVLKDKFSRQCPGVTTKK